MVALILVTPSSASHIHSDTVNKKIYYEEKLPFLLAETGGRNTLSWATFDMDDTLTKAEVQLNVNEFIYDFVVQGTTEAVENGYIGQYQGYFLPNEKDEVFTSLVLPQEPGVLVSANVVSCDDDMFFTLVFGVKIL